ncbi:MAG: 2-amino-4-hydroxy-6-hydroxymethyldihydropteridine diphosphokinase [Segniliparus sp.]|uniref:2-amino-4-hydroxy-6- hydroxymethyldihydropteridine diphosphokinase n=1 Tax=Segniliparus sp. TaxID=2804064 RepID=UPI003F2CA02B
MTTAVLSIGSNLGNRLGYLQLAVAALGERVRAGSPVYETDPWGAVGPNYFNAVLVVSDLGFGSMDWLREAQRIETLAARKREAFRGPRTLDVDVIACYGEDGASILADEPELLLPHPRAHQRAFVLVPWLDVQPEARLAARDWDVSVKELVESLAASERTSVRRTSLTLSLGALRLL